ncbi:DNA/RNA non-specific endonuclease [Cellulomonas fimi]|uniref:DNA/RNA non-specific endonuclease n=1 Tax=Cellulomonas fimi TaxID=1708 RepID=UPI00234D5106|nr:DNA/RNA non-specific endonuclease [Cellulomonas fimi]MDC7120241.1 DNA/RNA non-specific endonuclease [Cellulomonas fimi]
MSTHGGVIDPPAIPGDMLDPDGVIAAADCLAEAGEAVRDHGAGIVAHWRGLAAAYQAPEADQLFAVMNPVEGRSRDFGDDVEKVAAALRVYAEAIRPIKATLARVQTDAMAFRRSIASDPDWQENQQLVDANAALVARVNAQQVALWEAERTCANAIRALYCAAPWHAMTGEDDPLGYGLTAVPIEVAIPWGSAVAREDKCPKAAAVQVKRFVWEGIVVDGLWSGVTGLAQFAGFRDWRYSEATLRESWMGIADLVPFSYFGLTMHLTEGHGLLPLGRSGDAWKGLGKGMVSWDTWGDDPARAAGGTVFNIATIFFPVGAAVSGTKSAATAANAAAKGAKVSSWLSRGAEVLDWADPLSATVKGAQFALPRLDDLAGGLRVTADLESVAKLDVPEVVSTLDDAPALARHDELGHVAVRDVETVESPVAEAVPLSEHAHTSERHLVGPDGRTIDSSGDRGTAGPRDALPSDPRPSLWDSRGDGVPPGRDEPPTGRADAASPADLPADVRSLRDDAAARFPDKTLHTEISGHKGSWNATLNNPQPNSVYVVDERSVFVTDELGRVDHVEARWEPTDRADASDRRHRDAQTGAGGQDRRATDVGGHIQAAGGGGPGERVNIVAMDRVLNGSSGAYGKMEASIRALARENPTAQIDLVVDIRYPSETSLRPDRFTARVYVNGVLHSRVGALQ